MYLSYPKQFFVLANIFPSQHHRMTQFLPDNLLALFAPRPPISYKPPPDELFINRKHMPITGIAGHIQGFEVF
jgi:hypothetical protein